MRPVGPKTAHRERLARRSASAESLHADQFSRHQFVTEKSWRMPWSSRWKPVDPNEVAEILPTGELKVISPGTELPVPVDDSADLTRLAVLEANEPDSGTEPILKELRSLAQKGARFYGLSGEERAELGPFGAYSALYDPSAGLSQLEVELNERVSVEAPDTLRAFAEYQQSLEELPNGVRWEGGFQSYRQGDRRPAFGRHPLPLPSGDPRLGRCAELVRHGVTGQRLEAIIDRLDSEEPRAVLSAAATYLDQVNDQEGVAAGKAVLKWAEEDPELGEQARRVSRILFREDGHFHCTSWPGAKKLLRETFAHYSEEPLELGRRLIGVARGYAGDSEIVDMTIELSRQVPGGRLSLLSALSEEPDRYELGTSWLLPLSERLLGEPEMEAATLARETVRTASDEQVVQMARGVRRWGLDQSQLRKAAQLFGDLFLDPNDGAFYEASWSHAREVSQTFLEVCAGEKKTDALEALCRPQDLTSAVRVHPGSGALQMLAELEEMGDEYGLGTKAWLEVPMELALTNPEVEPDELIKDAFGQLRKQDTNSAVLLGKQFARWAAGHEKQLKVPAETFIEYCLEDSGSFRTNSWEGAADLLSVYLEDARVGGEELKKKLAPLMIELNPVHYALNSSHLGPGVGRALQTCHDHRVRTALTEAIPSATELAQVARAPYPLINQSWDSSVVEDLVRVGRIFNEELGGKNLKLVRELDRRLTGSYLGDRSMAYVYGEFFRERDRSTEYLGQTLAAAIAGPEAGLEEFRSQVSEVALGLALEKDDSLRSRWFRVAQEKLTDTPGRRASFQTLLQKPNFSALECIALVRELPEPEAILPETVRLLAAEVPDLARLEADPWIALEQMERHLKDQGRGPEPEVRVVGDHVQVGDVWLEIEN